MTAHILLNSLNELRKKRSNARQVSHFISFSIEFNKFDNTGARMLDSIYHMTFNFFENIFGVKTLEFCPMLTF